MSGLTISSNEQSNPTYLISKTNFSFYLKRVELRKKHLILDQQEIHTIIKQSIDHFNNKMNNLENLPQWNKNLFNANLKTQALNHLLKNNQDNLDKTRYLFTLEINQDSSLYVLYDKINLSISFNDKIKQMHGNFSLNKINYHLKCIDYMKKQYVYFYINRFISDYLSGYSYFELLFALLSEKNNYYQFLKQTFVDEIQKKIRPEIIEELFSKTSLEVIFRDLMLLYLVQLSIIQSISNYFKTEDFYKKIKKDVILDFKKPNEIAELLHYLLHIDFPQDMYYRQYKQKFDETYIFNLGWKDFYLATPVIYNQLGIENNKAFLKKDFSKTNPELFFFIMFLIKPNYYNVGSHSIVFNDWKSVAYTYYKYCQTTLINNDFVNRKFKDIIIESNYNYIAFLNKLNVLVTTEYAITSSSTFDAYEWVQTFISSVNLAKNVIKKQARYLKQKFVYKRMFFFKQAIDDVHDLALSSMQEIYNYDWSKNTIASFYQDLNLSQDLEELTEDLKYDDEFYKKQMQRQIIIFGFFVATLIAFVDYGNMTWTVLSCSQTNLGMPLPGGAQSAINQGWTASSLALLVALMVLNAFILIGSISYIVYAYKKMKKISKKQRVRIN